MLSSIVHHPCEVSLHLYSSDIFVHPPRPSSDLPGDDKTLRGLVEVRAPSDRTIQGIRVTFTGMQTLAIPQRLSTGEGQTVTRYENKQLMEKVVEISRDGRRKSVPNVGRAPSMSSGQDAIQQEGDEHGSNIGGKGKGKTSTEEANLTIESQGIHLDKGIHGFEFAFIVPASSPSFERSKYGRVRYTLTATALGAGRGRSNISTSREIFIISQVNQDGGPVPLEVAYNDAHDALGALSVNLISASLTVGGAATFSVYHPSPPPGLNVHVYRAFVEQTTELYSSALQQWIKLTPEKLRIWERGYHPYREKSRQVDPRATMEDSFWLASEDGQGPGRPGRAITDSANAPTLAPFGWSSLATSSSPATSLPPTPGGTNLVAGVTGTGGALMGVASGASENGYKFKAVLRLPDDNTMRPSTVRGARAEIKISHEIGVEVYFSRSSVLDDREDSKSKGLPKVQLFSMRRPVFIQSCCSTFDHIHLPPYTLESPMSSRPPSRPSSPGAVPIPGASHGSPMTSNAMRGRSGGLSREPSQSDLDHWRLKQTLKAALGGHHASPGGSGVPSSGHRSAERSLPGSQPASRNTSPTRHSSLGGYFGRRSRPSSPTRNQSHEHSASQTHSHSQTSSLSTSPAATSHHFPLPRRGHGLHALTPSNRPSPQAGTPSGTGSAVQTTTPGTSPPSGSAPMPIQRNGQHLHTSHHPASAAASAAFPTVVTSPSASTAHAASLSTSAPRSLPPNAPWALGGFPTRTPTSHDSCQCGKTTEELIEAEHRLMEGVPTAPGMWISTHDEGEEPPPWMPSRPVSPDMSAALAAASLHEDGAGHANGEDAGRARPSISSNPPSYASSMDADMPGASAQHLHGWHRGANGTREGGRARGKLAEAYQ